MTETLDVAVNREGLHSLEVPERYEVSGPFVVRFHNYGEGTHLYLNLDDRLSEIARIEATNHYVEADERRNVDVKVRDPVDWPTNSVQGKMKIVAAHGQETHYVDVVFDSKPPEQPVEVDPELAKPPEEPRDEESSMLKALPVAVLGGVALMLAAGSLFAGPGINFALGATAVVAAGICALAAFYLLG